MTSMSLHEAPTVRRVSPPPPSLPSAPPTERSGHGDGSTVQASAAAASTVMGATARRQERIRSGRYGRSSSGRPSLRWAPELPVSCASNFGWPRECEGEAEPPAFTSSGSSRQPITCEKPTQRHLARVETCRDHFFLHAAGLSAIICSIRPCRP